MKTHTTIPYTGPSLLHGDDYAANCSKAVLPDGYRFVKLGETILEGDLVLSFGRGPWDTNHSMIGKVLEEGRWSFIRKVGTPAPVPAPVKTLKYEVVARQNGLVAARITEQSHRGAEFGEGSDNFGKLESRNSPENAIGTYRAKFFVLGNRPTQDNDLMLFTADQFEQFEKEVAAYNAHFSKPKILRTVFFKYNGGSIRGYRRVEVIKEDSTHIEGLDSDNGEYRKYLKSKIVGPVDTVKA